MKPSQLRTLEDFYNFYAAIPTKLWTTESWIADKNMACRCGVGHLGPAKPKKGKSWSPENQNVPAINRLRNLLGVSFWTLSDINEGYVSTYDHDGFADGDIPQAITRLKTPKARVLAYLRYAMKRAAKGVDSPGSFAKTKSYEVDVSDL